MNGKSHTLTPSLVFIGCFLLLVVTSSSQGQQTNPDAGFVAPRPKAPTPEPIPMEKPARLDIGGIVAQAFNMKTPLQMINPLAPAKYGNGGDNVSWDPDKPEKPRGFILLGIQW